MLFKLLLPLALLTLVGCASVVNDSTQVIKLETKTATGNVINGAECKMSNDFGVTTAKSGETVQVHRSSKDLDIVCTHPDNPDAVARAISRANAGMWGNIIIGGGVGAIIDHTKGTAYTYPTWVQLIFGKTLVFDRASESDSQPVSSTELTANP
jgi:hypothetical protein